MKNKILLNGATRGSNFGDYLFAYIFQKEVAKDVPLENIYWYQGKFAISNFYKKWLGYKSKRIDYSQIACFVSISGGYFCGDDKTFKHYLLRYLSYFHVCLKCIVNNIPVAFIGIDVASTKSKILEYIERFILNRARLIIVRNQESAIQLKKYNIDSVIVTTDTVHSLCSTVDLSNYNKNYKIKDKKLLFLHFCSEDSFNILLPAINKFLQKHREYIVYLGKDQVRYHDEDLERCLSMVDAEYKYIAEYNDPLELCNLLSQSDFIVTSKLHVGIVGSTYSKSVVAFPIHPEKTLRFYKQINQESRVLPLSEYTSENGYCLLENFSNCPIVLDDSITELAKSNISQLHYFVNSNVNCL